MTLYGYIDESGTMARDKVFAIGLVICSGKNQAERIHFQAVQNLFPGLCDNPKALDRKELHFYKMSEEFIVKTAMVLKQAPIQAFVSYRYHDAQIEQFSGLIEQYKVMARGVIYSALEKTNEDLVILLGGMGQKEKFEKSLCSEIESVTHLFAKRNKGAFRKVSCSIASARVKGVQLADFYAGATRRMLLNLEGDTVHGNSSPFHLLESQIVHDLSW